MPCTRMQGFHMSAPLRNRHQKGDFQTPLPIPADHFERLAPHRRQLRPVDAIGEFVRIWRARTPRCERGALGGQFAGRAFVCLRLCLSDLRSKNGCTLSDQGDITNKISSAWASVRSKRRRRQCPLGHASRPPPCAPLGRGRSNRLFGRAISEAWSGTH